MNTWEAIFTQSPANDGRYDEENLPHQHWEWPKATWFQARRDFVRERQPLATAKANRKLSQDCAVAAL